MSQVSAPANHCEQPQLTSGNIATQTWALLIDACRDLQSRKLFWLTLVLSGLVAGVFGFVGIDPTGISIFGKHLRGLPFNSNLVSPAEFYKSLFTSLAIPWWLGFFSAILGLVTVSGMFPDMITSGSIDVYLSRPISRVRLFVTKYVFGLMFMALQVLLFSVVSFLVIGFRGGSWEFGIFLAVPLVTLFFSYLFCVCVLVGIVTRSSLAAILLTALFWGFLLMLHATDMIYTPFVAAADERVAETKALIAFNEKVIADSAAVPPEKRSDTSSFEFQRNVKQQELIDYEAIATEMHWWQDLLLDLKTPLPKTNETISLMSRWLVSPSAFDAVQQQERDRQNASRQRRGMAPTSGPQRDLRRMMGSSEVETRVVEELNSRDVPWIVGTSLGFEAVVLVLGAWLFARRDF